MPNISTPESVLNQDYAKECAEHPLKPCIKLVATAELPTRFGHFNISAFYNDEDGKEHIAITKGDIENISHVLTRIHSECLTGDALGSLRCDCRDQLISALKKIEEHGSGIILYMRQEGRGIGLINKVRAYALQDHGYDTIEADQALGFSGDERNYGIAAGILKLLGVKSINLMTNNPEKYKGLTEAGIIIAERVPHIMKANEYNAKYLEAKKAKGGHLFE